MSLPQERLSFRSKSHVERERNAYGKLSSYFGTLNSNLFSRPRSPVPVRSHFPGPNGG